MFNFNVYKRKIHIKKIILSCVYFEKLFKGLKLNIQLPFLLKMLRELLLHVNKPSINLIKKLNFKDFKGTVQISLSFTAVWLRKSLLQSSAIYNYNVSDRKTRITHSFLLWNGFKGTLANRVCTFKIKFILRRQSL